MKLAADFHNSRPKKVSMDLSAFTLTELLVVIAIIGILAALLLTAISQAKGKARTIQCANNVRQLGTAMQLFTTDFHYYPLAVNFGYWKGSYPENFTSWNAALENQISTHFPREHWMDETNKNVWSCPAATRPKDFPSDRGYSNYGYNGYGLTSAGKFPDEFLGLSGNNSPDSKLPSPPIRESQIASPSEMIEIGDGFHGGNGIVQDSAGLWRGYLYGYLYQDDYFDGQGNLNSTKRSYARHQGKANVVFCDGHVESPTLQFLFEDTSDAALVRWNRDHQPHREKLLP